MNKEPGFLKTLAIILIAVPMLGIMAGGIYSLPAIKLTKGREPWLSLLLAVGLAITIFGLGATANVSRLTLGGIWVAGVVLLLLARWFYGSLSHSLESFGAVHLFMLMAALFAVTWKVGKERRQAQEAARQHQSASTIP